MKQKKSPGTLARWLVCLAVLSVPACSRHPEQSEPKIRPVRVLRVEAFGGRQRRSLSGVSRAGQEIPLSFRVPGTIVKLNVRLGDKVKKGDVIAKLDDRDAQLKIQAQKAALARAQAQFRAAQADYARMRALFETRSASKAELDAARAAQESGSAAVNAEQQGLQLEISKSGDHVLKARMDGTIAARPVEVDQNVRAGELVAMLNAGDFAEIEVAVPESLIGQIKVGDRAQVHLDAIHSEAFPGVVSEVGVAASEGATTFPMKVQLESADDRIRSGMAAVVVMDVGDPSETAKLYVEPKGVLEDQKGRFVLVAVPKEKGFAEVKRRDVKVAGVSNQGLEIESGVKPGDLMIVAGLRQLRDGQKVKLLPKDQPKYGKQRLEEFFGPASTPVGAASAAPPPAESADVSSAPAASAPGATKQ